MYSEILDDELENKVIKNRFIWKPRVVLAILWLVVVWRFIEYPYFNFELLWGVLGLSIASYYFILDSSLSKYSTFILLALGMFGIINHFMSIVYFSIGSLTININYLVLLIIHATLSSEEWVEVLQNLLRVKSRKVEDKKGPLSENRFLKKYETKTIIQSTHYSKDAIIAAKLLLKVKLKN